MLTACKRLAIVWPVALGYLSFDCPAPHGVLQLDVRRVLDMQENDGRVFDGRWVVDPYTPRWMPVLYKVSADTPFKRVLFGVGDQDLRKFLFLGTFRKRLT